MTPPDDDIGGMETTGLPDDAIEAFFVGDAHGAWEQDEALVDLRDKVLTAASGPAPRPSPELLAFLGEQAAPTDRGHNVVPLFRRLRLTAGFAAAAGVAAAALAVAATTGALPEPAMRVVSWVVEAVTPFELDEPVPTPMGDDEGRRQEPTTTVAPGAAGAGPGSYKEESPLVQPGGTTPSAPPPSMPPAVPVPVQPPTPGVDQRPTEPFVAPDLAPPAPAPPAGPARPAAGGGSAASTTTLDRSGESPAGITNSPARR